MSPEPPTLPSPLTPSPVQIMRVTIDIAQIAVVDFFNKYVRLARPAADAEPVPMCARGDGDGAARARARAGSGSGSGGPISLSSLLRGAPPPSYGATAAAATTTTASAPLPHTS